MSFPRLEDKYVEYAAPFTPNFLEAFNVERTMLDTHPEYPSAACMLTPVLPLPFRPPIGQGFQVYRDTSLTRQLNQVIEAPDSIDPDIPCPPDAFVFTANSAIPVADAVRAYFAQKGESSPRLARVEASRMVAHNFWQNVVNADTPEEIDLSRFQDEVDRLRSELDGAEHVTVIDQYVYRGRTLMCAGGLLHLAGVPYVTGIRGRWYEHVERFLVDTENVTAKPDFLRKLMRDIGRQAFRDSHSGSRTIEQYTNTLSI